MKHGRSAAFTPLQRDARMARRNLPTLSCIRGLKRPEGRAPLCAATSDAEKATLQNAVTATDRQLDQLVYELYGLTPEEIQLVEGTA